jgi:hypothetical protein
MRGEIERGPEIESAVRVLDNVRNPGFKYLQLWETLEGNEQPEEIGSRRAADTRALTPRHFSADRPASGLSKHWTVDDKWSAAGLEQKCHQGFPIVGYDKILHARSYAIERGLHLGVPRRQIVRCGAHDPVSFFI